MIYKIENRVCKYQRLLAAPILFLSSLIPSRVNLTMLVKTERDCEPDVRH